MNKKLIFPVAALAVIGFGLIGTGITIANESTNTKENIVERIAERFGLNEAEVQKVFDEVRNERLTEMQEDQEERLAELVSNRKITEEQKMLILNKQKELQAKRQSYKNFIEKFTPEERKNQMEIEKTELEDWASKNGIDLQYLMQIGGKNHGRSDFTFNK